MIYVDNLRHHIWKGRPTLWCHMISDTSEAELTAFAVSIGLNPEWIQRKSITHYDLRVSKRKLAVAGGAREVSSRELVTIGKASREL